MLLPAPWVGILGFYYLIIDCITLEVIVGGNLSVSDFNLLQAIMIFLFMVLCAGIY